MVGIKNSGDSVYKVVHLWSIRSFGLFIRVETTKDVEASPKTREVRIYNRVPGKPYRNL